MANGEIYEKNLSNASGIGSGDYLRTVNSNNESEKINYTLLAKAIIEQWTGSTLAGSAQSVKSAIDSLNSNSAIDANSYLEPVEAGANALTRFMRSHNVAIISIKTVVRSHTEDDVIATIPEDYRPSVVVYGVGTCGGEPLVLRLSTSGVIDIWSFTNRPKTGALYGVITWTY